MTRLCQSCVRDVLDWQIATVYVGRVQVELHLCDACVHTLEDRLLDALMGYADQLNDATPDDAATAVRAGDTLLVG